MKKQEYGLQETTEKKKGKGLLTVLLILGLALLVLVAMGVATQKIAAAYAYSPALGAPLFVLEGFAFYLPWTVFDWALRVDPAVLDEAQTMAQIAFIVPLLLVMAVFVAKNRNQGNAKLHGSAHWAKRRRKRDNSIFGTMGRNTYCALPPLVRARVSD